MRKGEKQAQRSEGGKEGKGKRRGREGSEGQRRTEQASLGETDSGGPGWSLGVGRGHPGGPGGAGPRTPLPAAGPAPPQAHWPRPAPRTLLRGCGAVSAPISSRQLPHSPWKQSRNSSRCPAPFTCMMDTGKLWEEEANTAGAKEWSFLSRNSVKAGKRRSLRTQKEPEVAAERGQGARPGPTLQRVLLHVNLVEFIGSDEDTVVGEVDTAAGLRGLDLLRRGRKEDVSVDLGWPLLSSGI